MNRIGIVMVVQALALIGAAQAPAVPASSPEQQLFKLLNTERENAGVQGLRWDPELAEAALEHAQELANHAALSHRFAGEAALDQRVGSTGARFDAVAENVALADDAEDAHLALMNSPGHRANIMNPKYNAVGIGAVLRDKRLYVAQDFARVLPAYSEQQFRDGIVAAFNRLRHAHNSRPIAARPDPQLDRRACSAKLEARYVLQGLTGATRVAIFTATQPTDLPKPMDQAAADINLRRMDIGVCFRPASKDGFAEFSVVAAFFSSDWQP